MKRSGGNNRANGVLAVLASLALVLTTGACGMQSTGQTRATPTTTKVSDPGNVAIFTPSDGITLSQHTPLNKWAALVPELKDGLAKHHIDGKRVTTFTDSSLDDQSKDLQDYVVSHLAGGNKRGKAVSPTTLVIAPFTSPDSITRQYGDYVTQPQIKTGHDGSSAQDTSTGDSPETGSSGTGSPTTDSSDEETTKKPSSKSSSDKEEGESKSYDRLVSSLKLAKEAGMHVVLLANDIPELSPDLFVDMSNARSIGEFQATKLASKLELDKASKDNPVRIEVLLPRRPADEETTGTQQARNDRETNQETNSFPRQAFAGIWQVLGPYFKDGRAVSPSGLLTKETTDKDWMAVTFDPGKDASATKKEVAARLHMDSQSRTHTAVDGILAMNDFIVSGVVSELGDLGYTGSAADINPEISISGIVGSITGKHDLNRKKVPKPAQGEAPRQDADPTQPDQGASPQSTSKDGTRAKSDDNADHSAWPIISGYGAYVDNIPQIVDGEQWMTAIEDRKGLAADIAAVCENLNKDGTLPGNLPAVGQETLSGRKVNRLTRPQVAVSASNLKSTLIDTNYIKPAEAGL